jgi:HD-like signal output (HDOD) protein
MTISVAPPRSRPQSELIAAARALGASGGGAGAARVLSLLYNPDVEIAAVLDCLRAEPGLAARVLKVANAPYYRQAGNIGTVDRAVAVLGLTAIRGVAASGCLDRLTPPRSGKAFDPERFRLHSLAVACAAQELATATGAGFPGEAYMAGLLHDIGWLLLVKADPAAMATYLPPPGADHAAALAAEQAHFGTTHEACARLLTEAWAMPDWLALSIVSHHSNAASALARPGAGLAALPGLLALADHVAQAAGFSLQADSHAEPTPAIAQVLGCTDAQLQALIAALPDTLAALQAGA